MCFLGIDDRDALILRRAQRVRRERHRVFGEFDDVDLFAAQFANDRLHAHALHAHAGAHAVHVAVAAGDGDLGALAGFARAAFDHHGVVVNLRHFLLEQAHHQLRRRRAGTTTPAFLPALSTLLITQRTRSPTLKFSSLRLLLLGQPRFGLAQIHHQVLALDALHDAVHQLAHAPEYSE
jgi:hypothetical protein